MLGLMILTCYDVLSEHSLFKSDSEVKNISIITLMLLEFLDGKGASVHCDWGCEFVRLCDEASIELDKDIRKQIHISKDKLATLRDNYNIKKTLTSVEFGDGYNGDGYKVFAMKVDWKPSDDIAKKDKRGIVYKGKKMWFRWEWPVDVRLL
jgi:hypothetical protein